MTVPRIAAIAALALVLSALMAWALQRTDVGETIAPHSEEGRNAALEREIVALRAELAAARAERLALSAEVERLRAELDGLAPAEGLPEEELVVASEPDLSETQEPDTEEQEKAPDTPVFDESLLLAEGMSASEALRLREKFESLQMEELYLRDLATREGWVKKGRFYRSLEKVRDEFRNSMSDDDFDRLLYAAGRNNRVVLTHVLNDSPAEDAGLMDGDVVMSYDDARIFMPRDLQRATPATRSGELTPMIVLRDGELIRVFLPGGPIGAQLSPQKEAPDIP